MLDTDEGIISTEEIENTVTMTDQADIRPDNMTRTSLTVV